MKIKNVEKKTPWILETLNRLHKVNYNTWKLIKLELISPNGLFLGYCTNRVVWKLITMSIYTNTRVLALICDLTNRIGPASNIHDRSCFQEPWPILMPSCIFCSSFLPLHLESTPELHIHLKTCKIALISSVYN